MNRIQAAEQLRRALQIFATTLTEEEAMEVPAVYDPWKPGKAYKGGEYFTYGVNAVGDPQLYRVNEGKNHTSQENWLPSVERSLYTPIGLDDAGYPVWAQPTGSHDAYNKGDIVNYNGTLYQSLIDGNTYSPEAYPAGWVVYTA